MNEELFQMILSPNKKLLRQENISQSEFTDILLFVGSSRIPRIGQILSEFFDGKNLSKGVDLEEAAAYGGSNTSCNT